MSATAHQRIKIDESLDLIVNKGHKRILIKGSAGVGKTFMVDELLTELLKYIPYDKYVFCSAPTNKAVYVLSDKINNTSRKISLVTTHSALKIGRKINEETGEVYFAPSFGEKNPPLKNIRLFIIDESSMIGAEMLKYVEEHATKNNTIVIFIGDDKQINPVKEEDSPVFMADYPEVELTEIIRQGSGNPIINLSRNIDAIWEYETRLIEGKGFVYTYDESKVITELAQANGSNELKYIAWTNPEVDRINGLVRNYLYGANPSKIELGETIIFDSPYKEYFTNQELKVETVNIETISMNVMVMESPMPQMITVDLKCYIINGKLVDEWSNGKPEWKGIFVIHEESEAQFKAISKQVKFNAKIRKLNWKTAFTFTEKFAEIKYNHAITIHKSQGSTYNLSLIHI